MKEAYCSLKVAKFLKEKGFLQDVDLRTTQNLSYYDNIGLCHNLSKYYDSLIQDKIDFVIAPTHQMAMAWLREKGIEIDTYLSHITEEFGKKTKHYVFSIVDLNTDKDYPEYSEDYHYYPTYEEAVEAALKYSLENLI